MGNYTLYKNLPRGILYLHQALCKNMREGINWYNEKPPIHNISLGDKLIMSYHLKI